MNVIIVRTKTYLVIRPNMMKISKEAGVGAGGGNREALCSGANSSVGYCTS